MIRWLYPVYGFLRATVTTPPRGRRASSDDADVRMALP